MHLTPFNKKIIIIIKYDVNIVFVNLLWPCLAHHTGLLWFCTNSDWAVGSFRRVYMDQSPLCAVKMARLGRFCLNCCSVSAIECFGDYGNRDCQERNWIFLYAGYLKLPVTWMPDMRAFTVMWWDPLVCTVLWSCHDVCQNNQRSPKQCDYR